MERAKKLKRHNEELSKREAALAAREAKLNEQENWEQSFLKDPLRFLEKRLGPDAYDKLSAAKLAGGVTPGMVQLDVEERLSAADKTWQEKFVALEKKYEADKLQSAAQEKQAYESRAIEHVKANAEKYPLIHAFEVAENIPHVIEYHFHQTTTQDEDGNTVRGEVWTPEQAAAEMEKHLLAKVEAADKARAAVKAKTQPQDATTHRSETPQRRSLSTDLGGTSRQDRPPPMTEADRMKRAMAAIDALGTTQPN